MKTVTLQVEGMSCQHCVHSIEGALRNIGVSGKVDLKNNEVSVTFDEEKVALAQVKSAVEEQGYDVL
ncbi:MAG TPA: copper ion binding protein [Paenibacillus sp.]|nr:copper ion binding protein [Paenibacillus sp.]